MSRKDLLAILVGDGPCPEGLTSKAADGFQAFFGGGMRSILRPASRKSALKGMVQRQRDLERLMDVGTVLPALPGTRLAPDDVPTLIAANRPLLKNAFAQLNGRIQYQISVSYQKDAAAKHFGWPNPNAADFGTAELAGWISDRLADATQDLIFLPREADMLWNGVVLLPATKDDALTVALEQIDALWSDGFRIRQIGPSPAVSFLSLGIRHIQPIAVEAARKALNVTASVDPKTLAAARRSALMAAPAEDRPDLVKAGRLLEAALRAGTDRFPEAFTWREGQSAVDLDRREVA